jgi:hypothetical protein
MRLRHYKIYFLKEQDFLTYCLFEVKGWGKMLHKS